MKSSSSPECTLSIPSRIPSLVALSGWLLGVAAAVLADAWLLPHLLTRFGGKRIEAMAVGLLIGLVVMTISVEAARIMSEQIITDSESLFPAAPIRRRKTPAEQMPLSARILIAVVAVFITGGMIMSVAPLPLHRLP